MSTRKKVESLQDKVLIYFRLVDSSKQKYMCLIDDCKKDSLSGVRKYNLVSHAKTQHQKFFDQTFGEDRVIAEKKYPMPYRRLKHMQKCVEIVAVNGNPFTMLSQSGVGGLLLDELEALRISGFGVGLGGPNYAAIKNHIKYLSGEIHEQIKLEVRGKFVSVMADSASKYTLSIMGISIQYMYEGELKIRSIGMINMTKPQTALHMMDVIFDRLQKYGINKNQLISFTTDNANSMIAMVKLMNELPANNMDEVDDDDDDEDDIYDEQDCHSAPDPAVNLSFEMHAHDEDNELPQLGLEQSVSDYESESDEQERQNEVDEILDENVEFDKLLKELQKCFSAYTMNIHGIRCAIQPFNLPSGMLWAVRTSKRY